MRLLKVGGRSGEFCIFGRLFFSFPSSYLQGLLMYLLISAFLGGVLFNQGIFPPSYPSRPLTPVA